MDIYDSSGVQLVCVVVVMIDRRKDGTVRNSEEEREKEQFDRASCCWELQELDYRVSLTGTAP